MRQICSMKWAATELLEQLNSNQTTPPLLVMERFRNRMDQYSLYDPRTRLIFESAREAVGAIIDTLLKG